MDGSFVGNILGIGYCLLYQLFGIVMMWKVMTREEGPAKVLLGSVFGSVCMMWLPALFSVGLGFGLMSHLLAVSVMGLSCLGIVLWHHCRRALLLNHHLKSHLPVPKPSVTVDSTEKPFSKCSWN